ncbi:CHAT domain-containing protein [Kitasatospora kazusensis]|uniref:CHAT domain-containing protein n=1 Tax=Kitasatospora kazusensis TaxID=407974 RepID=UPI0031DE391F
MGEVEDGGVRGLRAWAADAEERAKRLLPVLRGDEAPLAECEASVAELEQLSRMLEHEPALCSAVSMWLGSALALRQFAGGGVPADRERAQSLLREVRDRGTALGATASEEHRQWAALVLVSLLSPLQAQAGFGDVPDLTAYVEWMGQVGPAGMLSAAKEVQELFAEIVDLPLPPEFLAQLSRMQQVAAAPTGEGISDLFESMIPDGDPFADRLRQLLGGLFGPAGTPMPAPAPAPGPATGNVPPDPAPDPATVLTPDALRRIAAGLDAVNATTYGLDAALNSADPHQAVNDLLGRLRAVQDQPPPGFDPTAHLEGIRALLLNASAGAGGTLQDREAGRRHMAAIRDGLEGVRDKLPPGIGDPMVMARVMDLYSRIMDVGESGNTEADVRVVRGLLAEAEQLAEEVPDGFFRGIVLLTLGAARAKSGIVTGDRELLLNSLSDLEGGMSTVRETGPPFGDTVPIPPLPDFDLLRAALTDEPTVTMPEHHAPRPDAPTEEVYNSALSLVLGYGMTRDRTVLDRLIGELERVRDGVREGRAPRIAAEALWQLAEAYRVRGVENDDVADIAALAAAEEALTALAADVVLQAGAEHGLVAARAGASRGVRAALWAGSQGRPHEAVAALESGRALVLHAASASSAVPELLEERGHHELAGAWRAATASADGAAGAHGVPAELPSTLRRRALEALGYRQEDGLLAAPTLGELADGLADSGADALLYLVPGDAVGPGIVIAVAPELGVATSVREQLSQAGSAPLERYLDAAAAHEAAVRETGAPDPALRRAWEDALAALCDWAFEVLGPVIDGLEQGLAADGRPLRIVLVPCGRLGIVPWHAARMPGEQPRAYLCRRAAVSYAASGSQFLRTLRRAPRPPAAAPVLLADPTESLVFAEIEVLALRDSFYPDARVCGAVSELADDELAPCTPDAVLGYLADGVSVLHVAAHGSAGTNPTASALSLPDPDGADGAEEPEESAAPGPRPELLTVTRLLEFPDAREPRADGPLVVLSACQTDLSTRDHDEALTLTTGFVTAGARDVVGSRWAVSDGASAVLMAVFHHYLNVDRLSPVDALRAAQLWMLDPDRRNPGTLHGDLLREMRRPDLDRIAHWAAFIHQGHPGPGRQEDMTGTKETAEHTGGDGRNA